MSRRRISKKSKVFDGKKYLFYKSYPMTFNGTTSAKGAARFLREDYFVRRIKQKDKWVLYTKKK